MHDVIVIGAGPAGLATAACLRARGVDSLVLEAGDTPLAALRRVDPATRALSPARLSRLPGMASPGDTYPTFAALVAAFDGYRARHRIEPRVGAEVTRVTRAGRGFAVHLAGETLEARAVVDATGMIRFPHRPPGAEVLQLPCYHSLDVRRLALSRARDLLVIGGGTSAVETLESWLEVRAEGSRATMAARSHRAVPHRILGVDIHYLAWLPEHLPAHPALVQRAREPAIGRAVARALSRGDINRAGAPLGYRADGVRVADGSTERLVRPDLVVLATGFRHAAPHLGDLVERWPDGAARVRHCQSRLAPGLFAVGARFGRSLASHFLRGIARDARFVADAVARRLEAR